MLRNVVSWAARLAQAAAVLGALTLLGLAGPCWCHVEDREAFEPPNRDSQRPEPTVARPVVQVTSVASAGLRGPAGAHRAFDIRWTASPGSVASGRIHHFLVTLQVEYDRGDPLAERLILNPASRHARIRVPEGGQVRVSAFTVVVQMEVDTPAGRVAVKDSRSEP